KLIKKHALQHGDVITIGHHQLRFSDQQTNETEQDEFEKTMVIPAGHSSAAQLAKAERAAAAAAAASAESRRDVRVDMPKAEPRSHTSTAAGVNSRPAANALPLAKLQVLSGAFAGRELELTKTLTTLGRPGIQVAAITRRAEGYFVVHVESGEKGDYPLVNGQPIGAQAKKLRDNDVLQLAGVKMGFFTS
ncbi:MAG: FHA domain-containing protein, partial [Woeseiaceae bacterium]